MEMNEASKSVLLDVERLQQLSYERSTKWASFLDRIDVSEGQEGIDISDLEDLFDGEPEEQDELASMEDESCDENNFVSDVLGDITNSTRLVWMLSSHNKTSKLSETTIMQDENNDLVDLFNQTIPVINEHNRQMKESGFDRILNTFDAKKIEEKVGGWLRRHNSCMPDYNPELNLKQKNCQISACRSPAARPNSNYYDDTDSDDSLHSGGTARYIRSCRAGTIKHSSSPTMTIKTYRMVKSTRQALKDKYACAQDDDAEVHLNKLRHRRRIAKERKTLHLNEKHSIRSHITKHQYMVPSHSSHTIQKRKVFRKRSVSNSCSAKDTSSESDSNYSRGTADKYLHRKHKCCGQRYKTTTRRYSEISSEVAASVKRPQYRALMRTPCNRRNQKIYYERTHSHSISSSSSLSQSPPSNNTSVNARKCSDKQSCNDNRPIQLESQCRCCNEKRLCQKYTHLADTSTDEWLVENTYSPKKLHITPPFEQKLRIPKTTSSIDDAPIISTTSHTVDSPQTPVLEQPTKICSKGSTKTNRKKTEEPKESLEDSFELELQMALKASKELYEKEQNEKSKKKKPRIGKKREALPTKSLVKKSSKDTAVLGRSNLKKELSVNHITAADKVHQQFRKLKHSPEDATFNASEETFFAASKIVCNSTALPNDKSACQRQIEGDTEPTAQNAYTNKTPLATEVKKNLRNTSSDFVCGEESEKYHIKSSKDTANINDNGTPIKMRRRKASADMNSDEESIQHKTDTPRPKSKISSTKLRKISQESGLIDNDGFVKPRGLPKKIPNTKSNTKSGTETTYFSGLQVIKTTTAAANDKSESGGQNIKQNDAEQDTVTPNNSKQENKIMPAQLSYNEDGNNANIGNISDLLKEHGQTLPSLNMAKQIKMPNSIKSSLNNKKSTECIANFSFKVADSSILASEYENGCTEVSSTTNMESQITPTDTHTESEVASTSTQNRSYSHSTFSNSRSQQEEASYTSSTTQNHSSYYHPKKGVLIYSPHNSLLAPPQSFSNDGCFFHITKEHISNVIGEKPAEKFLKYYMGRRRFNTNSTIYFKPPASRVMDNNDASSSDSDVDDLENIGQYGDLYESIGDAGGNYNGTDNDTQHS